MLDFLLNTLLENLALRQQILVLQRTNPKPPPNADLPLKSTKFRKKEWLPGLDAKRDFCLRINPCSTFEMSEKAGKFSIPPLTPSVQLVEDEIP